MVIFLLVFYQIHYARYDKVAVTMRQKFILCIKINQKYKINSPRSLIFEKNHRSFSTLRFTFYHELYVMNYINTLTLPEFACSYKSDFTFQDHDGGVIYVEDKT